jgi:hypothetical protein
MTGIEPAYMTECGSCTSPQILIDAHTWSHPLELLLLLLGGDLRHEDLG